MEEHFPLLLWMGWLRGSHFGGSLRWGWRLHLVRQVVLPLWLRWGPGCYWGRGRRSLWGRFLLRADNPGGMLSRVDIGAFPSSRWKGVTIIPWNSGEMAWGQYHRQWGRWGGPFPPLQWPLPQDTECLWHVIVELSRLGKHHGTLPPW